MKLSVKGRYALLSLIYIASKDGRTVALYQISHDLNISKLYLEQVFAVLKKEKLVNSLKGAAGGYVLSRDKSEITAYDVLKAIENNLFEEVDETSKNPNYEKAIKLLDTSLNDSITYSLKNITLAKLLEESKSKGPMFYI
ncbi:MAG: Rrf2 family transcriptional regulator [Bacilli bacterium]